MFVKLQNIIPRFLLAIFTYFLYFMFTKVKFLVNKYPQTLSDSTLLTSITSIITWTDFIFTGFCIFTYMNMMAFVCVVEHLPLTTPIFWFTNIIL